jgi:phosphatidylglycerophosphate synthase
MPIIPRRLENAVSGVLEKVARSMIFTRLSPNFLSTLGISVGVVAAVLFARGEFTIAGVLVAASGVLDLLDGKIARNSGKTSVFGAVFDSTVDRATELVLYTGIGAYFILRDMHWTSLIVVFAAGGSWLVSYVRARAESFGVSCHVGFLRRGERFVLLAGGAILSFAPQPFHDLMIGLLDVLSPNIRYAFPPMPLTIVIVLIAVLSPITVVQRLVYVWRVTKSSDSRVR